MDTTTTPRTTEHQLEMAIDMLKRARTVLRLHGSGHVSDKLQHEMGDLLTELGHEPPERRKT